MKIKVKKIRLDELEAFVNSKIFEEMEYVPISPLRAKSYLANPNAQPGDIILYLGFIKNKLVAFRSLLPDIVYSEGHPIRFAWCSGSWVHPNFRRKGFSEHLLKEAYSDWQQKLMLTNYAPSSEKLFLKTGWFHPIHEFNGVRLYLYPKTRKLIKKANSNAVYKAVFSFVDAFLSAYSSIALLFYRQKPSSSVSFKTLDLPDKQCIKLVKKTNTGFQRAEKELEWIFTNPWISGTETASRTNYPFSSYSNRFYYKTIKVFSNNKLLGFFLFSVREGHLKTLYWQLPAELEKDIVRFLKLFCKENKIEMATIYKNELATELFKRKFPFLYLKKYGQKIYSTFPLKNNSEINFQDGDGDVIFT